MDITTRAATAIALTVKQGLNFILDHFQDQQIFPSSISTKTTKGRQILVVSDKEALARFAQANFFDCRISTYPPNTYWEFFSNSKVHGISYRNTNPAS